MEKLAIISSYNPEAYLLDCVNGLKEYFPDFDILIVDSDSDKRDVYGQLPNGVDISFSANKNYEMGAYKIGFAKNPNYDVYMCLQDTTIATGSFDFSEMNDNSLYVFDGDNSGWAYSRNKVHKRPAYKMIKDTFCETMIRNLTAKRFRKRFRIAKHNMFVGNRKQMEFFINDAFPLPTSKTESQVTERLFGLFFTYQNDYNKLIPLNCFEKVHGGRV